MAKRRRRKQTIGVRFSLDSTDAIKRLRKLPERLAKEVLDLATRDVSRLWMHVYHVVVPYDTGKLSRSARVRSTRYRRKTRVGWTIEIPRRNFDGFYYPVPLEFGWIHKPEGVPFFRRTMISSRQAAIRVAVQRINRELRRLEAPKSKKAA